MAFYAQFYRCYSPIAFPKKTDKEGAFVRRYVPELERYPAKFIYEPWKAPILDQRKAGCLVRGDGEEEGEGEERGMKIYPKPMFDFNERRGICIEGVKNAYRVGLHGNDEAVKNGSWRKLFPDDAEGPTEGTGGVTKGKVREVDGGVGGGDRAGTVGDTKGNGAVDGDKGKALLGTSMDDIPEEEKVKEGAKGGRHGRGRDLGIDEDETEAKELGGETRGGDHVSPPGKRKRKQATLDGVVEKTVKKRR